MATRYFELPPDEHDIGDWPGLVVIEEGGTRLAAIVEQYGAFEVTKERAIEILKLNHMADGYLEDTAQAIAIEDIEEFEA